jgi:nucleoside-diphosphate-sugar epimerase
MRVLVTGATGFLGKRLVRHLLRQGLTVRCLVRPSSDPLALRQAVDPGNLDRLELHAGTLSRVETLADTVAGCEVIYHLAAAMSGAPAILFLDNVVATRKLLELLDRVRVRRLVLVSSLGIYGSHHLRPGDVLDESCPPDPLPHLRDPYTYSKISQEQIAWQAHREQQLPLVVVRPGVIYGPGRDCLTARVGLRLGRVLVKMGGRQPLPYTHVDNCAQAIALAGTVPAIEGDVFNIVDDDPPTGGELVKQYRRAVGGVRVVPVCHWAIDPLSRLCEWYYVWSGGQLPLVLTRYRSRAQWKPLRYSNAKAKSRLGWQPQIGFSEGLGQTFAWLRQQATARAAS